MTILQINTTLNSGSTGRIAEQLGERIIKSGGRSNIAYSRQGSNSTSSSYQVNNNLDIYKHILDTRLFDNHGFSSTRSTKKLIQYIENLMPDVIHLHNVHGYYLNIEVLFDFLAKYNKPVVWTLHDCWAFTGHCAYFDRVDCEKWKTGCYECPLTKYYPKSWYFDNSKNNFNKKKDLFNRLNIINIVTPSSWLKNLVKQSFLKKYSVNVIHNGIDLDSFKPKKSNILQKFDLGDSKILLGVASVWDSRKGFSDFLKLSEKLSSEYKIILVGLTKDLIKKLPKNIIGIERTENTNELAQLYSSASVYLNPTYSDNFPTTNIEALACGTPVITYQTGGSPEAIDANTGLVVEKGNITQLVSALQEIIQDNDRFKPEQCRGRAESLFNKDDRFDDYVELYKKVISEDEN